MHQGVRCAGGLAILVVGLSATVAAQDRTDAAPPPPQPRWVVEAAAGLQTYYSGHMQSVAFGFTPTRSLTLLAGAQRSHVQNRITIYEAGYSAERGGREHFISVEFRYAFLHNSRISPFVLAGSGRGVSRPNVNEVFPDRKEYDTQVFYYGGGARIPFRPRLDGLVDWRLIWSTEARSDYLTVRGPVRVGLALRF